MWPLAVCAAVAGCSSILGIPSGSLSFCARPENQGHTYCEDYDVGDALGRIPDSRRATQGSAVLSIQPSDDSPPNLIDFTSPATADAHNIAGYYVTFQNQSYVGLQVNADVKVSLHGATALSGDIGFLMVGDSLGSCVGFAVFPAPPGVPMVPAGTPVIGGLLVPGTEGGCNTLVTVGGGPMGTCAPDGGTGGGPGTDGGLVGGGDAGMPAFRVVPLDQWFHLTVQIEPEASGAAKMLVSNGLTSIEQALPPMTVGGGEPIVGFAAAPTGCGYDADVRFDNVTVDVAPQQLP